MSIFGCIEAGGTKFMCGVGSGPGDLKVCSFPTSSPEVTVRNVSGFLRQEAGDQLDAIGIGSFGPVDLDRHSATFGYITSTPKVEWQNYDLAGSLHREFGVPVGFDTDVNAAALGEARWGAGRGFSDFIYITVGTGIGGGAIVGGEVVHGLVHPEMGHIRIPHDLARDPFPGGCPYHRDCLEGLASGPAMEARWKLPPQQLPADHPGWALEAHYLALGLATWVCTLSPQRIVIGGGVMQHEELFPMVRKELARLLNGYVRAREVMDDIEHYVVPPKLGNRAGLLGAVVLAERAQRDLHSAVGATATEDK
jgi:fructokinase